MKNLKFLTLAIAILGFTATSFAQNEAEATAESFATIITPLSLVKVTNLSFGNIISSAEAGEIIVNTNDVASNGTGGATMAMAGTGDDPQAASFEVTGEGSQQVNFTIAATELTHDGTTPVNGVTTAMTLSNFTTNISGSEAALTGTTFSKTLTASGTPEEFKIGATLNVGATQSAGKYTGSITLTAIYQ